MLALKLTFFYYLLAALNKTCLTIEICTPECLNGGTCLWQGTECTCPIGWGGSDCTTPTSRLPVFPGNDIFQAQASKIWTASDVYRKFILDSDSLPPGFNSQPTAAENCCPPGSFVQDNNCYFLVNTPAEWNYQETVAYPVNAHGDCARFGATLATFELGNQQQKIANFIQWMATEHNFQPDKRPVDLQDETIDPCLLLGIYRDSQTNVFYWQTIPPTNITAPWVEGEPLINNDFSCIIPHKKRPMLRSCGYWNLRQLTTVCMIRKPCTSLAVCKTPSSAARVEPIRLFDRCMTTGIEPDFFKTLVNRYDAEKICQSDGGYLASIRQQFEVTYWMLALDSSWSRWTQWNIWYFGAWIGYNHLTPDYYWDTLNIRLGYPYHVGWGQGQPNDLNAGAKHVAIAPSGWFDKTPIETYKISCESDLTTNSSANSIFTTTISPTTTSATCVNSGCCVCPFVKISDPVTGADKCYDFSQTPRTWKSAMSACTQSGGYLAVADTFQKIQSLISHPKFIDDSYWVSLSPNSYGIWAWPNSNPINQNTTHFLAESGVEWPTNISRGCYGAIISKSAQHLRPICDSTIVYSISGASNSTSYLANATYNYLCEIAHSAAGCLNCVPPMTNSNLTSVTVARVAPDKCVWLFNETGNASTSMEQCKLAGLRPVALLQYYEHTVVGRLSSTVAGTSLWIDLYLRETSNYTWEGEPTSYDIGHLATTPAWDNTWYKSCAATNSESMIFNKYCHEKALPVCTIPSATNCSEMCPRGFVYIAGSCFIAVLDYPPNLWWARKNCLDRYRTYNLASVTSDDVLQGLTAYVASLGVPAGSTFSIGMDNSLIKSHTNYTDVDIVTSGDPDSVWEFDDLTPYPPPNLNLTKFWAPGHPVNTNFYAYLLWNNSKLTALTTTAWFATFFICERPNPCEQCDDPANWLYFNGDCLRQAATHGQGFRNVRAQCDFWNAYLGVPELSAELWMYMEIIGWSNYFIGVYRRQSYGYPATLDFYETEDGMRLSAHYNNWDTSYPNGVSSKTSLVSIGTSNLAWEDTDPWRSNIQWGICKKKPILPTLQNTKVPWAGSSCGDSLISPQYLDVNTAFSSSSVYVNGSTSYPASNILTMMPWGFLTTDSNPWIKISFNPGPVYIRSIATLGGLTNGYLNRYSLTYKEDALSAIQSNIFVHKSTAFWTKGRTVTFIGNSAYNKRFSQEICPRIKAYEVTIYPRNFVTAPLMRIELKGCSTNTPVSSFCECWIELFGSSYFNSGSDFPFVQQTVSADSQRTPNNSLSADPFSQMSPTDFIDGWSPVTAFGFWQIDFAVLKTITGLVMTSGNNPANIGGHLAAYSVMWSHTGYHHTFNYYLGPDGIRKTFVGQYSDSELAQQTFCPPIKGKSFRIIPLSYSGKVNMVINIFGCNSAGKICYDCCDDIGLCNCHCPVGYTGPACSNLATDKNYFIDAQPPVCEDSTIYRSTFAGGAGFVSATPGGAATVDFLTGIITYTASSFSNDGRQYFEINFGKEIYISVMNASGDGSSQWVQSYSIWFYVAKNAIFYPVLNAQGFSTSGVKNIVGSRDPWTFLPYYLCPTIRTNKIRIAPNKFTGTAPKMRLAIGGCSSVAPCATCCTNIDGCQCKCPVGYADAAVQGSSLGPWPRCEYWSMSPIDCEDYATRHTNLASGTIKIYPPGAPAFNVYCDFSAIYVEGWTVIQRRIDKSTDFFRTWNEYKAGFGSLNGSFWLGNDKIYQITSALNNYHLLFILKSNDEQEDIAYYLSSYIESEEDGYNLHTIYRCSSRGDSFSFHNGQNFSTWDNDTSGQCAQLSRGGWWYSSTATSITSCHKSNLNGNMTGNVTGTTVSWATWRNDSLATTQIMARRSAFYVTLPALQPKYRYPADCQDILENDPFAPSGVYKIYPPFFYSKIESSLITVTVYCEMAALGGGWTIIQRRFDSNVTFNQTWDTYTTGFGDPMGNFYLGNVNIWALTNNATTGLSYQLAVVLEDSFGEKKNAVYDWFTLLNNNTYEIFVSGYKSANNDSQLAGDSLTAQNNQSFKTWDRTDGSSCAGLHTGGWWWSPAKYAYRFGVRACSESCLNGGYNNYSCEGGIYWNSWKGRYDSLSTAVMMIKRSKSKPLDCLEIFQSGVTASGVYYIYPYGIAALPVYCDMSTVHAGKKAWTVIQRRSDFDVSFDRNWSECKRGFSHPLKGLNGDHWLGLENVYQLQTSTAYSLLVTMRISGNNNTYQAYYKDFKLEPEVYNYTLYVDNFNTTGESTVGDSMTSSNFWPFVTYDHLDHIPACLATFLNNPTNPWWMDYSCKTMTNLNGYQNDSLSNGTKQIKWQTIESNFSSIVFTQMAILRKTNYDLNVPHATTNSSNVCGYLIEHRCIPPYQPISGDSIRIIKSNKPGVLTGSDLICKLCNQTCYNGGTCAAPNICNCTVGWTGIDCSISNCFCYNNGTCPVPGICTCVVGFTGAQCENISAQITGADLLNMTNPMLEVNVETVTEAIATLAVDAGTTDQVCDTLATFEELINRYSEIALTSPSFGAKQFVEVTKAIAAAADSMMYSMTNSSEEDSAIVIDETTIKCLVNDDNNPVEEIPPAPPVQKATKDQLRRMFNAFISMLINMFAKLRAILPPGADMTFGGKFYGATVFNMRFGDLPGLHLQTCLADVTFPTAKSTSDLVQSIPSQCSPLTDNSTVPIVLSAFIINVNDVDLPFNMPTVAVKLYCPEQYELTFNSSLSMEVVAIPSVKKSLLFASQKKDAQCDISKVHCSSDNALNLGSLVSFPLSLKAGDFVLIFPVIEYNYTAYIAFNSPPNRAFYHWIANVTTKTVVLSQNGTYPAPRYHYRAGADMRIIIPGETLLQLASSLKASSQAKLYVFVKKNLTKFIGQDELPKSACELQRCYGYHLRIGLAKANSQRRRRDATGNNPDGFELEPQSNESAVVFKSSYFGDYGADLAISPNTIEFSEIFANFATLVADNAAVLAFQVGVIVCFLICIAIVSYFDKTDLKEWAFLPIISNHRYDKFRYLVSVHYMKVRNYDVGPRIYIRILGNVHDTEWRLLHDGIRKNFDGRKPANFTLSTMLPIGRMDFIEIKVEQGLSKRTAQGRLYSAHIDRVVLVDSNRGFKYIFLARTTMKTGDAIRVELAPEDEIKGYSYLVTGHSRSSFTDVHPWVSIAQRPLPSHWTRCERLACVVSALFMAMMVNTMFYGKEATAPKVGLKVGNWFTMTWFTVWTSFVGCLIVIPPTAIIGFIFKNVKRRSAEKSNLETVFNVKVATPREPAVNISTKELKKEKKPLQLSYYWVILGWILVGICVGTSAFIVVMYSLSWGQAKSLQWLAGMTIHIFQDILLIQPVKVLLTALVSATVLNMNSDGLDVGRVTYNRNSKKKNIELFYRLRRVLVGIFHHLAFLVVFFAVIAVMTNSYAYLQVSSLKGPVQLPNIEPVKGTINNYATIFDWLEFNLVPNFLTGNQLEFGGIYKTASVLYSIKNPNLALLGPIRLRQQRSSTVICPISTDLSRLITSRYYTSLAFNNSFCQNPFSDALGIGVSSEQRLFNGSWAIPMQFWNDYDISNASLDLSPWVYRRTEGWQYFGWEATYQTGGYYVDLPRKKSQALAFINKLRCSRWLDNSTSALFVDLNLFNAQCNLFISVRIIFESLSAGGMSYHVRMYPLQLYQYTGPNSLLVMVIQAIWVLLLISHLIRISVAIKKDTFKKFKVDGWNWLDLVQIVLGLAVVSIFSARIYFVIDAVTKLQTQRTTFINLETLVMWEDVMFCALGVQCFLAMLLSFRHLSLNKHWAVLLATLSSGKLTLLSYGVLFGMATIAFAGIAYLVIGFQSWSYSSYSRAIFSLIQAIIGTADFTAVNTRFHVFFIMMYNAVVIFFGGNVFITIILSAHGEVARDAERKTNWDAALSHYLVTGLVDLLKKQAGRYKPGVTPILDVDTDNSSPSKRKPESRIADLMSRFDNYFKRAEQNLRCELLWKVNKVGSEKEMRRLRHHSLMPRKSDGAVVELMQARASRSASLPTAQAQMIEEPIKTVRNSYLDDEQSDDDGILMTAIQPVSTVFTAWQETGFVSKHAGNSEVEPLQRNSKLKVIVKKRENFQSNGQLI